MQATATNTTQKEVLTQNGYSLGAWADMHATCKHPPRQRASDGGDTSSCKLTPCSHLDRHHHHFMSKPAQARLLDQSPGTQPFPSMQTHMQTHLPGMQEPVMTSDTVG